MRDISGWVESIVLRREAEDFFHNEDRQMKKTGFYIIKDKFFEDMPDPYLKGNETDRIITVLRIRIPEYIG